MSFWDDEAGYDLDDPKHPTYAERMLDATDMARKRRREWREVYRNRDPGDESDFDVDAGLTKRDESFYETLNGSGDEGSV